MSRHERYLYSAACLILFCAVALTVNAGPLFQARIDFDTGDSPNSVAVSDLDGDGVRDLAVSNNRSHDVSVLLGRGDGTFDAAVSCPTGNYPGWVSIADLDGDGNPDLVVVCPSSDQVSVHLGFGDGTFDTSMDFGAGEEPQSLAIADLDGDGDPDLAVVNPSTSRVSIMLGVGDGTFAEAFDYGVGVGPFSVAIDDLDGDDVPDLVLSNRLDDDVSVLLGDGDGTFGAAVDYAAADQPWSVAIADLDGDDIPDLAVAHVADDSSGVAVLPGNGDGTFGAPVLYDAGDGFHSMAIADLDGDSAPDLVVTCQGRTPDYDPGVMILPGNGDGSFGTAVYYRSGYSSKPAAVADLNGDDIPDLAVAAQSGHYVSMFLGLGDGSFGAAVDYDAGDQPESIAIGDLDGDHVPDLAVTNLLSDYVSVHPGLGDARFAAPVEYTAGAGPTSVAIADLDGDGDPDLAVSSRGEAPGYAGTVAVLPGNGDGTFGPTTEYDAGSYPISIAIGDLDGDGDSDLVVLNWSSNQVSVLLGHGDGQFDPRAWYATQNHPTSVAIADLDGDGFPDLAVSCKGNSPGYHGVADVFLGNGDGTFGNAVSYSSGHDSRSVVVADFDGDHHPDLVLSNHGEEPGSDGTVALLPGHGDGTFGAAVSYPVGRWPGAITVADLDGDTVLDLAVTNALDDDVSVLLGNGDGTFLAEMKYGAGNQPVALASDDLDGDGDADLAVVNLAYGEISILRNLVDRTPLVIVGPGRGPANPPLVRVFTTGKASTAIHQFPAYGPQHYGVNLGLGDVNGDGLPEILTGAGPGPIYGPHVRGFLVDGTPLPGLSFLAYGTNQWGVNVAAGDIDGDQVDEIITGAGPGAVFGPHVRGWRYDRTGSVSAIPDVSYFAYGTPKWGVNVAAGDIDGDGYEEIVTGAGPGDVYGPHVRGWNVDGGAVTAMPGVSYLAYGTDKFGVNVTCGDVDGDGIEEIVTGPGPGIVFGAHVRGWNYDGAALEVISGIDFFAWPYAGVRFGARVFAGSDLDGDGRAELVVGGGPDPAAGTPVKVYRYEKGQVSEWFSIEAFADLNLTHGTSVAAGRF